MTSDNNKIAARNGQTKAAQASSRFLLRFKIERTRIKGVGRGMTVRVRGYHFHVWCCVNGIEFRWKFLRFWNRRFVWWPWKRAAKRRMQADRREFWKRQWRYEREHFMKIGAPQDWIDRQYPEDSIA